jgi:glyoxylase-like metal-dependent hydrolase (beta-lactamase superfamily II)
MYATHREEVHMTKHVAGCALFIVVLASGPRAQDAKAVIAGASKALGAETLTSITYSGSAATGNFGQSKAIGGPLAYTTITNYTRAIDLAQPASRATGATMPPAIPGAPPPQPGTFNQNITPANTAWNSQLEIWITPWGFLKGAAANNATVSPQRIGSRTFSLVSWVSPQRAPSGSYRVNAHINEQNLVERVETWVEHPVMGDLNVQATYENYKDFGGLKVPTRITQSRAGLKTFEATITGASANPANIAELLTPPAAAGRAGAPPPPPAGRGGAAGAPPAPPTVESEKLADGVYRITGGYIALAVEFNDFVVVVEGGQSEARGQAIIAEVKRTIPKKPIRFVVNTHPHFDHASGLAPFAAEGITIVTHQNNRDFLERALGTPRTLLGDALFKSGRKPKIQAAPGDKYGLTDGTRTVDLYHIKNLEHSDGMLVAHLPKERILFTGDFNVPAQGQPVSPSIVTLVENIDRLKLDFDRHVLVHAPNPDRPMTKADLLALVGRK